MIGCRDCKSSPLRICLIIDFPNCRRFRCLSVIRSADRDGVTGINWNFCFRFPANCYCQTRMQSLIRDLSGFVDLPQVLASLFALSTDDEAPGLHVIKCLADATN